MKKLMLLLMILALPALALGQAQLTGRITGTVSDEDGAPVVGALVTIQSPAMQGERQLKTNESGEFLFALLRVGPYRLVVSAPNKKTMDFSFSLKLGQTVPLDVVMQAGKDITEEVTVYGTATALETTAGGENFSYDDSVEGLPIQNRDIEAVATYAPNISFGPTPGSLSVAGAPSFDTVVLLDGAEVSDPYFGGAPDLYLEDAVEEVQVLTTGVSARYGRFQGGVINAITKSGSNKFAGKLRVELDKESWDSKTPFGEDQSDDLNKVYQATVGGYVMKDRLWFFLGARNIPDSSGSHTTGFTGQSYTTTRSEDRWQVKIRGAVTPDHVVEYSHLDFSADTSDRAGLPAGNLSAANGQRSDPRTTNTISYQGVLSDNLFLDVLATQKNVQIQSGGDPNGSNPALWLNQFLVFNNHWWDFSDASVRDNETIGVNLTQVFSTEDWGDHTIEYGGQYVKSTTGGENRQSATGLNILTYDFSGGAFAVDQGGGDVLFNMYNLFAGDPGLIYRWEALPLGGDQEIKNTAAYVQDSWQYGKWRFDLGLRWEQYTGKGPFPTLDIDFNEVAPRLGATYNVTPDWQVQASWGKYISRFNDNVASNVTGVGGAPYVETIYTGPTQLGITATEMDAIIADRSLFGYVNNVNNPETPTSLLDPNASAPFAKDFNLSIRHALPGGSGSFTATFTNRKFEDLLDDFSGGQGFTTVADPFSSAEFDFDTTIWKNAGDAQREYRAITLAADYRPGYRWSVGGNWTWSETFGNYEGEGRNTPSSGSVIGDYPNVIPYDEAVPFGYLDEDIRHRVRAWGNYRFDFERAGNLAIGAIFAYQSGANWNKAATVDLGDFEDPTYISPPRSYTRFFDGRGQNHFNSSWRIDLSARYEVKIWKDLRGWLKLSALNVLDNDEVTSFRTSSAAVTNDAGQTVWRPLGNDPDAGYNTFTNGPLDPNAPTIYQCMESPSQDCSGFGQITSQGNYQAPRMFLLTIGLFF